MQRARRVVRILLGMMRVRAGRRGPRVLVMEQDGQLREGQLPSTH